jgi:hypothetical protein
MKRNFLLKASLLVLFLLVPANLLLADCIPVAGYDRFTVEGSTIILYVAGVATVKFDVNCPVQQTSKINLLKGSVCDGDDIEIDGSKCSILTSTLP